MDPYRRQFKIGLYHGKDSGHVIVYCNDKIIVLDFSIKENKHYAFYIGHELFDLDFIHENGVFNYELKRNDEAPTPLNQAREKNEKEDLQLMVWGFGLVVLIILIGFLL